MERCVGVGVAGKVSDWASALKARALGFSFFMNLRGVFNDFGGDAEHELAHQIYYTLLTGQNNHLDDKGEY